MGDQTGPDSPQPGPATPPPPPDVAPASPNESPFTDRLSQRAYGRMLNHRIIRNARAAGMLTAEDEVLVAVPVTKLSPGIGMTVIFGLLPGIIALSLQRQSMIVVTEWHVIVFPFFTAFSSKPKGEILRLTRPVNLTLAQTPKRSHTFGNKVTLPSEISQFLGRPTVYVLLGNIADYAFQIARTAPS